MAVAVGIHIVQSVSMRRQFLPQRIERFFERFTILTGNKRCQRIAFQNLSRVGLLQHVQRFIQRGRPVHQVCHGQIAQFRIAHPNRSAHTCILRK